MLMTRQEFEQLTYDICKSQTEWAARFALLRHFDHADRRAFLAECARNTAQLKVEEQAENFQKQAKELREALNRWAALEKAEAVWIREANLLREALQKSNDAVIEAEAKAEKYYRKVRELEIALQLNCKMDPPATLLWEFEKADNAHELAEAESKIVRLQSLLHSAIEQADATYAPYRKMVQDARAEVETLSQKLNEVREVLK